MDAIKTKCYHCEGEMVLTINAAGTGACWICPGCKSGMRLQGIWDCTREEAEVVIPEVREFNDREFGGKG